MLNTIIQVLFILKVVLVSFYISTQVNTKKIERLFNKLFGNQKIQISLIGEEISKMIQQKRFKKNNDTKVSPKPSRQNIIEIVSHVKEEAVSDSSSAVIDEELAFKIKIKNSFKPIDGFGTAEESSQGNFKADQKVTHKSNIPVRKSKKVMKSFISLVRKRREMQTFQQNFGFWKFDGMVHHSDPLYKAFDLHKRIFLIKRNIGYEILNPIQEVCE